MEAQLENGLIIGHAYTISDVRNVRADIIAENKE